MRAAYPLQPCGVAVATLKASGVLHSWSETNQSSQNCVLNTHQVERSVIRLPSTYSPPPKQGGYLDGGLRKQVERAPCRLSGSRTRNISRSLACRLAILV